MAQLPPDLIKQVRRFIFDSFEETGAPPVVEQIMLRFGLDRARAFQTLVELQDARHIALVKGTQRILMAFPFSSVATPFRVTAEGKTYYANCAWDAVAIHVALGEEETIDSFCHHCAEEVKIHLKDGSVKSSSPENVIVYLALPASQWWQDIVNTCSNHMVFFSSEAHLEDWKKARKVNGGAALTVEQMIKLSIPLYKTKMSLDYSRPKKEELQAYFESLGLTGDFWRL